MTRATTDIIVCRHEFRKFYDGTSRHVVHAKEFNRMVLKGIYAKILHVLF